MGQAVRIVVTGMGIVSPVGCGVPEFWASLCAGKSGIAEITRFDASGFLYTRAGEVRNCRLPGRLAAAHSSADLATRFMLAAASESMEDARLGEASAHRHETGVVLSTNFGGAVMGENLFARVLKGAPASAADFAEFCFQRAADRVADAWSLRGPRLVLSLSCASGNAALAHGADLIRAGRAKVMITGGHDALSRFAWSGLSALRTMAKDEVRPFDKTRSGTIFSEGAGALVIEEWDHAAARGAPVYAELVGYAYNNNAYHMTAPAKLGAGSAAVMSEALRDAGLSPEAVDHVNAHGTATQQNDVTETQAIKTVFGEHACRMPVTAIKSMTGHMMGAAGSAEAIASIMTIRTGIIPPTTNHREPDPECDLPCVFNVSREQAVGTVLSNSAGIGGCNSAVIFRRTG